MKGLHALGDHRVTTLSAALLLAAGLAGPVSLRAQAPPPGASAPAATTTPTSGGAALPSRPLAGIVFAEAQLRGLPARSSLWSLLETVDPFTIVDRIGGPGLYLGEPERLGAHGSSWTQAAFRMDGLDLTDPERTGTPLMQPDPVVLGGIGVTYSFPPAEVGGAGPSVQLVPRPPSTVLGGSFEASYLPNQLQASHGDSAVPPVALFGSAGQGSILLSGPLTRSLGLLAAGRFGASRRFAPGEATGLDSRLASLFVHAVGSLSLSDRLRVVASGDRARYPFAARARFPERDVRGQDAYRHLHATWEHAPAGGMAWTASAGYQDGDVGSPLGHASTQIGVIERLLDGPVPELVVPATGARGRWAASLVLQPLPPGLTSRHDLRAGLSANHSFSRPGVQPGILVGELVDGIPARLWDYAPVETSPDRKALELTAWASDSVRLLPRFTLDLGARFEWTEASARGAESAIRWRSLLPRGLLRWQITSGGGLSAFAGYSYARHRLPLGYLAYGDPAAPAAHVYRWTDPNGDGRADASEAGYLVATAGPGTRPFFASRIDPNLRPPLAREFMFGFEGRMGRHWAVRVTGTERRDYRLIAPVNEGVTLDDYLVREVVDKGADFLNPVDDRMLLVYDRQPASFGKDRDVLTNPPGHDAHFIGADIAVERVFDGRWHMLFGGSAHRSDGTAGNRGFHVQENDVGVLGEAFQNPNAMTYTRGRLFFERGYVIKWSGGAVAGKGFRMGAVARYQDGQHFARKVVVPDLAQGPEAVQAYTRGHSRFTFTFTLDTRVEQSFALAGGRLAFVLDAFNLLNNSNEVEEDQVTTRVFRASTVLQPPRAVRLGLRYDF